MTIYILYPVVQQVEVQNYEVGSYFISYGHVAIHNCSSIPALSVHCNTYQALIFTMHVNVPTHTGDTEGNPLLEIVRNVISKPTEEQEACHVPKPILLNTAGVSLLSNLPPHPHMHTLKY